ncbi:MAG: SDR family oxidoreductase [Burkholderiales bacterium]|nr:SDR family oxidoreductase [Burkholderiales bacterium]
MNVFITGASSGIGAALAREFAQRGATLGLVARDKEKLEKLIATFPRPDLCTPIICDVTDRDELIKKAREFDKQCGGVDIVIADAGISMGVKTQYYEDLEMFDKVFQTNVLAMATTFHAFLPEMIERKRGTLVGIASVAGIRGLPGSEAYCASKSAVITYCESLRIEMKKYGIDVLTISPGFVKTPLTAGNPYKMPFILTPEEFAERAIKAILAKKSYTTIPWQMGCLSKIMRIIPNSLFDKILSHRKQKPRKHLSDQTSNKTDEHDTPKADG